jgi:hypothetical protein
MFPSGQVPVRKGAGAHGCVSPLLFLPADGNLSHLPWVEAIWLLCTRILAIDRTEMCEHELPLQPETIVSCSDQRIVVPDQIGRIIRFRVRRLREKLFLGHEKLEGWNGPVPTYLFWCDQCFNYVKDSPRGFTHRQYLRCPLCLPKPPWLHGGQRRLEMAIPNEFVPPANEHIQSEPPEIDESILAWCFVTLSIVLLVIAYVVLVLWPR